MGRSAKIVRSTSYEKVKKLQKGQVWRFVGIRTYLVCTFTRESGSRQIRRDAKSARPLGDDVMIDQIQSTRRTRGPIIS